MKHTRARPRLRPLLLCLVLLLTSCGGGTSGQPGVPTAPVAEQPSAPPQPTQAAPAPTARLVQATEPAATVAATTAPTEATAAPAATSEAIFVVPEKQTEALTPQALAGATFAQPDIEREVQQFFELVYQARTLERGGTFNVDALRRLVDGAYADYTIPLFEREVADAQAGKLVEARFSDISVRLEEWKPAADGLSGNALVSATRTRTTMRTDRQDPPQAATYQFRLERRASDGGAVAWVATDFLNPATNRWVSQPATSADSRVASEMEEFFKQFYAARTLEPGGKFDIDKTIQLTQLAYQDYTLPLLQRQQDEANAGTLTAVSYSNLKVEVLDFNPRATDHGGVATVQVTRTAHVTRPNGEEPPQTATYRFRVHDHHDDAGQTYWLAVDFFQPQAKRWVSEIAGLAVSVPSAGHG